MKRIMFSLALALLASIATWSQEKMLSLAGGYAFAIYADTEMA